MPNLERAQFFPRSPEYVWQFFTDIDNLNRFTPSFFSISPLSEERPELYPGQRIDYVIRLFGVPFRWTTLITQVDKPLAFVDCQARGPYAHFEHLHQFWEVEGGTIMIDRVQYRVGWGPIGWLAERLFVRPTLDAIFEYRRAACDELVGAE